MKRAKVSKKRLTGATMSKVHGSMVAMVNSLKVLVVIFVYTLKYLHMLLVYNIVMIIVHLQYHKRFVSLRV